MYYGAGHLIFQRTEQLRRQMTSAESIIWKHIHINEWKLKFRRQDPILCYVVDFYYQLKLVIEIDGGIHEVEEVKRKDIEREETLKRLGLIVIRFKNEEVYKNPKTVMEKIDQTIRNLQSSPSGDGGCKTEISHYIEQLKDAYDGEPWFGRNAKQLLSEIGEDKAFVRPNDQHSLLELVWHMATWREFTINCIQPSQGLNLKHFEELDWRQLDHNNRALWKEGLQKLHDTQQQLISILQQQDDTILEENVRERNYNYRKLINGVIQHDIYHLGQIAYIMKMQKNAG